MCTYYIEYHVSSVCIFKLVSNFPNIITIVEFHSANEIPKCSIQHTHTHTHTFIKGIYKCSNNFPSVCTFRFQL